MLPLAYLVTLALAVVACGVFVLWGALTKGPPRTVTAWLGWAILLATTLATPLAQIALYWKLTGVSPRDDLFVTFLMVGENLFGLAVLFSTAYRHRKRTST
jgi:hypothetical protein